ncbi:MAG TPA: ABC transporter permease [Stellaceae bacterium]|jgi:NitT/TauT family transport system permease protein|nr:ABC transporter permease [Stellaceae bacterium]
MSEAPLSDAPVATADSAPCREVGFRGGGFLPSPRPLHSWLAFAALLALWQAATGLGWIDPVFLPSPLAIARALWRMAASGELWRDLSISLLRIGAGWAIGSALGLTLGLAMGLSSLSRAIGMPLVSSLYPIPKIALLPLLILWLGIGEAPKVATIAAGVLFPTAIATFSGVDAAPRSLIRMGQSFGLPARAIIWKIVLPAALPSILAGFRISISTALLLVVSAEMIGAQFGIGAFLLAAGNLMQSDQLMAGVVVLSLLGLGLGALLGLVEKAFLKWR